MKMLHPKTTIAGILILSAVFLQAISLVFQGQFTQLSGFFGSPIIQGQIAAGLGLIAAADGSK